MKEKHMSSSKEDKIMHIYQREIEITDYNRKKLNSNLAEIRKRYSISLCGMLIGLVIGGIWGASGGFLAAFIYGLLCAAIGGSFRNFLNRFWTSIPNFFVQTGNFVLSFIIGLIKCIIYFVWFGVLALIETAKNMYTYSKYMKTTSGICEEDDKIVKEIRDYLEYYRCVENAQGRYTEDDIKNLQSNNTFAQMVHEHDENYAIETLNRGIKLIKIHTDLINNVQL